MKTTLHYTAKRRDLRERKGRSVEKIQNQQRCGFFFANSAKRLRVLRASAVRMLFRRGLTLPLLLILALVLGSSQVSAAGTITVNSLADIIADDGQCSLREAVIAANTDTAVGGCPAGSGADTIVFDPSLPSPSTIVLTLSGANEDSAASGDLDLSGILTIQGAGADQIILDGNGADRIFDIHPGATVTISGVPFNLEILAAEWAAAESLSAAAHPAQN
jgi:CSLREA domain-containing protein